MTGTAEGAVARISDRIIDCPASVIVRPGDCGHAPIPAVNTIAKQPVAKIIWLRMSFAFPSGDEVTIRRRPPGEADYMVNKSAVSRCHRNTGSESTRRSLKPQRLSRALIQ